MGTGTVVAFPRRHMARRKLLVGSVLGTALLWGGLLWVTYRCHGTPPAVPAAGAAPPERHYATPAQLAASGAVQRQPVGSFSAVAHDGRRLGWQDLAGRGPVVIVFVKKDCPCNAEFEPFFRRLQLAYRDRARFLGVIDGSREEARRYADANRIVYPLLADPDRRLISRFKVENGCYVLLLRPEGVVETLWPGYSASMLRELGGQIAALAAVGARSLDTADMPAALTTGCPFEP
jgi:peroxiredoxin